MLADTLIDGRAAIVIETIVDITINATFQDNPGPGLTLSSSMEGQERGRVYFAKDSGIMVLRDRAANFEGTVHIEEGPQPISFPQSRSYTSTIRLLPDERRRD